MKVTRKVASPSIGENIKVESRYSWNCVRTAISGGVDYPDRLQVAFITKDQFLERFAKITWGQVFYSFSSNLTDLTLFLNSVKLLKY